MLSASCCFSSPTRWKAFSDWEPLFPSWCFSFKTENPEFLSCVLYSVPWLSFNIAQTPPPPPSVYMRGVRDGNNRREKSRGRKVLFFLMFKDFFDVAHFLKSLLNLLECCPLVFLHEPCGVPFPDQILKLHLLNRKVTSHALDHQGNLRKVLFSKTLIIILQNYFEGIHPLKHTQL